MSAAVTIAVPGRVNLIGGHIDFHEGPVVCAAVDRHVIGRITRTGGDTVSVRSAAYEGTVVVSADGGPDPSAVQPKWGRLVAGVLGELAGMGRPAVGFELEIESTLPIGGGLSSSAAFEVMIGRSAASAADWAVAPLELAAAAQAAELAATGVPCGIGDQVAVALGGLMLLDCRDLEVRPLLLPPESALVVFDSGLARTLDSSPWAARRAESFDAARALGVRVLRDVAPGTVVDDPRARHVIDEIGRVLEFEEALRRGDPVVAGALMYESHASSRDLWKSSTPELDHLVEAARTAGAYGARLTGGGFGGCVVALVATGRVDEVAAAVERSYAAATGRRAVAMQMDIAPVTSS